MKVPVKPWEKTLRLNLCRMPLVHEETTVKISKMVTYIMISILKFSVICHKHCVDHTQASQTVGIHHKEIFLLWGSFMRNPHFCAKSVCLPHVLVCFTLQWTPPKRTHKHMFPLFQFISDIIPLTQIYTLLPSLVSICRELPNLQK